MTTASNEAAKLYDAVLTQVPTQLTKLLIRRHLHVFCSTLVGTTIRESAESNRA